MAKPQLPHAVTRIVPQRGTTDCAVACLAMYLRVDYEEALLAAGKVSRDIWRKGLSGGQIVRAARKLGHATRWIKSFDPDESIGIVWVQYHDRDAEHVVYLDDGVIFDPAHNPVSRWDCGEFFGHYNAYPLALLQRVESEM